MVTLLHIKEKKWLLLLVSMWLHYSYAQTKTPSSCKNSDFSMGDFTNWKAATSVYPEKTPGSNMTIPYYYRNGVVNGRHTLITTSTPDPFTCNNVMTLPPGERICVRLGNGGIGPWGDGVGYQRDFLDYTFSITPSNALLIYKYAIVLQDPNDASDPINPPHEKTIRPRFIVTIKDGSGNLIDPVCGFKEDYVDSLIPGFRNCSLKDANSNGGNTANGGGIVYRAWTTVGVDLRKFINQDITIGFQTWDCGLGGHFGYAYLTARCDSLGLIAAACTQDGGTVTVTAPDGFAYKWFPGGQTTKSIDVVGAKPGDVVSVELTTISGCKTTLSTAIYPMVTKAKFKVNPTSVCLGAPVSFTDSSFSYSTAAGTPKVPIVAWDWNFGDGATATDQNPSHIYKVPGDYTVKLKVTNKNGCTDTISRGVKVLPAPLADFTFTDICVNGTAAFTDLSVDLAGSGPIVGWEWTFSDDGSTSTLQNPTHTFNTSGSFTVKLKVQANGGCSDDTVKTIKIFPVPIADYIVTEVCIGDTTDFTDKSKTSDAADPLSKWIWNFGDNSALSSDRNPRHYYVKDGTYQSSMIVTTSKGCVGTVIHDVIVRPTPKANFTATPLCLTTPVQFTDVSTPANLINTWYWSFGDRGNNHSTVQNPQFKYDTAAVYQPKLVIKSIYGCADSIIIPLNIPPPPYVNFDANRYADCIPLKTTFIDFSYSNVDKIVKWEWNFGDGTTSNERNPSHIYTVPGVYTVSLTVYTENSCSQKYEWLNMMTAWDRPRAGFIFTPEVPDEADALVNFYDKSTGATGWRWDFGDGGSAIDQNPNHFYQEAKTYTIWQYVSNDHNCLDSISEMIVIKPNWTFFVPNSFTPNRDGKNTGFIPKGHNITQFQMWIFDRWGDMIYTTGQTKSPDTAVPWDGRANGGSQVAQQDVYVWLVELKDIFGLSHKYVGHVSIIK